MSAILDLISGLGKILRNTSLGRNRFIGKIHGFITVSLYHSDQAVYGPFKIKFDKRDRYIAKKLILYGEYEKHEIELLCSQLKKGDTVLDIGANIGLYTLFLSKAVGKNGKVISVEPDPENAKILRENIIANNCNNVQVLEMAFGSKNTDGNLFQVDGNRGNLSFADLNNTGKSIKISIRRADEVLKEFDIKPNAAKMDVEGAEPEIIEGLGDLIPNTILFEFVPNQLKALNHDPEKFLSYLSSKGYTLDMVNADDGSLTRCSVSKVMTETIIDMDYNILARRNN